MGAIAWDNFQEKNPKTIFRLQAVQCMFERNIPSKKVRQALKTGETIEDYSAEMPEPNRLILGFQEYVSFFA